MWSRTTCSIWLLRSWVLAVVVMLDESHGAISPSKGPLNGYIPSSKCRKRKRRMNRELYELRYRVEVFFHSLKRFRRIATRYDKTAVCYLAFLHVVCTLLSL